MGAKTRKFSDNLTERERGVSFFGARLYVLETLERRGLIILIENILGCRTDNNRTINCRRH